MLKLKLAHACHGAGSGSFYPYEQLWERKILGLSAKRVGVVCAASSMAQVVGVPVICRLFDLLHHRGNGSKSAEHHEEQGPGHTRQVTAFGIVAGLDALLHGGLVFLPQLQSKISWGSTLTIISIVTADVVHGATYSLLDALTFMIIHDKNLYGEVRLWAGVLWAISSLAVGMTVHYVPSFSISAALVAFVGLFVLLSFASVCMAVPEMKGTSNTSDSTSVAAPPSKRTESSSSWVQLAELIVVVLCMGSACAVMNAFVFLLVDDMEGSTLIMGVSIVLNIVTEVPAFQYSGWLIRTIGYRGILYIGVVAYAARLAWYGYVAGAKMSPWWILVAEPLHGVTFALVWSNLASLAAAIAKPSYETTIQGLLNATFNGAGGVVGAVVGGWMYSHSPRLCFWSTASLMAATFAFMVFNDVVRMLYSSCGAKRRLRHDPHRLHLLE